MAEARKACEILKARPVYAGQANGHAIVDDSHYQAFQKIVADESPDAVSTNGSSTITPITAPLPTSSTNRDRLKRRFALYYYEVSDGEGTVQFTTHPHVDITPSPIKRAACYAHASQSPESLYGIEDRWRCLAT